MDFKFYLNLIIKKLWLILLIMVVAGFISGYYFSNFVTPVYKANTTIYILYKSSDQSSSMVYSDFLVGDQLVNDYTELIKSDLITSAVIDDLKLTGYSPEDLASSISMDSKNGTRVMEISVVDANPERAMEIANSITDVFSEKVVGLMNAENVNILGRAKLPASPVSPKPLRAVGISVLASFLFSLCLVFLIEYFDNTIKSVEDVEKYLGLTVIGTIPDHNI